MKSQDSNPFPNPDLEKVRVADRPDLEGFF
jgi:hypothetical protein